MQSRCKERKVDLRELREDLVPYAVKKNSPTITRRAKLQKADRRPLMADRPY